MWIGYNTDLGVDPKFRVITRLQCIKKFWFFYTIKFGYWNLITGIRIRPDLEFTIRLISGIQNLVNSWSGTALICIPIFSYLDCKVTITWNSKDKNYKIFMHNKPGNSFLATFSASLSRGPVHGQPGSSWTPARRDIKWAEIRPPTTENHTDFNKNHQTPMSDNHVV